MAKTLDRDEGVLDTLGGYCLITVTVGTCIYILVQVLIT